MQVVDAYRGGGEVAIDQRLILYEGIVPIVCILWVVLYLRVRDTLQLNLSLSVSDISVSWMEKGGMLGRNEKR